MSGLHSFDPPASWYEPADELEADDVEYAPAEDFAISAGLVCWHAAPVLDDDDD